MRDGVQWKTGRNRLGTDRTVTNRHCKILSDENYCCEFTNPETNKKHKSSISELSDIRIKATLPQCNNHFF